MKHAIDTGKAVPTRSRPRRKLFWAPHYPWASNVVLVAKKDSRQGFAMDYRELNNSTKKDTYGTPQVETILDKLRGFCSFSVIDISTAYCFVLVRKEDREKTAFNTSRGLFEMCVMLFALVNSQATFQQLMEQLITDHYPLKWFRCQKDPVGPLLGGCLSLRSTPTRLPSEGERQQSTRLPE